MWVCWFPVAVVVAAAAAGTADFFCLPRRWMWKNRAEGHHTSTYFHTRSVSM